MFTETDTQAEMQFALGNFIRRNFGPNASIEETIPLSRRAAVTARLKLKGCDRESVFVKYIFPEQYAAKAAKDEHVEFFEEMLVHRFLKELKPLSPFKAELIDTDPNGIFLLEDLGEIGHSEMRTFEHLISRLARSLVMLHNCTRDHEALYKTIRHAAGLGEAADDKRRYGGPAQYRRFEMGSQSILRWAKAKSLNTVILEQALDKTIEIIRNPGKFNALIHDDLGNARQTFEKHDFLYLLDFEYARYGLCLIDLCKPMMGKFEVNLNNGTYLWNNPGFPMALADSYRVQLVSACGFVFDDEEWDGALSSAFIFHAMTLIGRLEHLEPDRRLVGTVQQNINGILFRLNELLPTGNEDIKAFLNQYLGTAL